MLEREGEVDLGICQKTNKYTQKTLFISEFVFVNYPTIRVTISLNPLIFAHSRLTLSARDVPHKPAAIIVREYLRHTSSRK